MTSRKLLSILLMGCLTVLSVSVVSAYPFSIDTSYPSLSNTIETGSIMNFKTTSFTTELGNRYATGNTGDGISIFNNIQVDSYIDGLPSKGTVSGFIKGTTMEGGYETAITKPAYSFDSSTVDGFDEFISQIDKSQGLAQKMEFYDFTSMSGDITSFSKFMSYNSGFSF